MPSSESHETGSNPTGWAEQTAPGTVLDGARRYQVAEEV